MTATLQVNDCYIPYLDNRKRYLHFWGGSGSGKSVFAAQKVILRIVSEKPHRILCIRKVANTLRSSVYQLLKDTILDMGLMGEFTINKSEMRFIHISGNEILLAGLDDVEKLKSIAGITSIWVEEATELLVGDFDQLDLRLRGETVTYKQIMFTYNPINENHWIKSRFHDSPQENFDCLRTTFKDNHFIDDEYRTILEQKASSSPNLYRIYYLGEWGKEDIQRPYCQNFNREKHISDSAVFNPQLPVYFSLDFNVEPFVCEASHIWSDGNGMHFHTFDEIVIEKNGDVPEMCDMIENTYGMKVVSNAIFTGDAMQRKREITQRNNIDAWRMIDVRFNLGRRLMVPKANPSVRENRHLVNAILAFHPDLKIHSKCKKLIYDMQFVEADADGDMVKTSRNKEAQRADALDAWRYKCNTFLRDFFERYKIKK